MLSLNFFTIVALTAPLLALLAGLLPAVQVYLNLSTEHCYHNVVTLNTRDGPQVANCISISPNGTVVGLRNFTLIEQTRADFVERKRYAFPGFHDGHGHIEAHGLALSSVKLNGAVSVSEVRERIKAWLEEQPKDEVAAPEWGSRERWIRGVGWDQGNWGGIMPTAEELTADPILKDKYIALYRIDIHCLWVSPAVLSLLPDPLPDSPDGGEIVKDPGPGVFCDNAMEYINPLIPAPTRADKKNWVLRSMKELNSMGITAVTDEGNVPDSLAVFKELASSGQSTVRVNALLECDIRNTFCPTAFPQHDTPTLRIAGVKIFADGALGSWGAALLDEYTDSPGAKGSMLINSTALASLVRNWHAADWQVHVHAIGDAAARAALDAFDPLLDPSAAAPRNPRRIRLEHSQIIHPADQARMHAQGIIPSVQPTHATSDSPYAAKRLGPTRLSTSAYRLRSLLPLGVILGSDFPVESPSILEGVYAAVARRAMHAPRDSTAPIVPDEGISVAQALRGFTGAPAYGAGWEGKTGELSVGAYADWVVLDADLGAVGDAEGLRGVAVLETWVGGRRVYEREGVFGGRRGEEGWMRTGWGKGLVEWWLRTFAL